VVSDSYEVGGGWPAADSNGAFFSAGGMRQFDCCFHILSASFLTSTWEMRSAPQPAIWFVIQRHVLDARDLGRRCRDSGRRQGMEYPPLAVANFSAGRDGHGATMITDPAHRAHWFRRRWPRTIPDTVGPAGGCAARVSARGGLPACSSAGADGRGKGSFCPCMVKPWTTVRNPRSTRCR
jgi:hypothetical protein